MKSVSALHLALIISVVTSTSYISAQTRRSPTRRAQSRPSQARPLPVQRCTLTPEKSPEIRGFRLGMTWEQVKALDSSTTWQEPFLKGAGNFNATDSLELYGQLDAIARQRPRSNFSGGAGGIGESRSVWFNFADIAVDTELQSRMGFDGLARLDLGFLNERLTLITVEYTNTSVSGRELANELIKTVRLPSLQSWNSVYSNEEEALNNSVIRDSLLVAERLARKGVRVKPLSPSLPYPNPQHPQLQCKGFTVTVENSKVTIKDESAYLHVIRQKAIREAEEEKRRRDAFRIN